MAKHTPGPWETDEAEHDCPSQDVVIRDAKRRGICRIWFDDAPVPDYNAEQSANARLIAAAPELVEALERFCQIASGEPFDLTDSPKSLVTRINENRNDARALLRKIKGE